MAGQPGFFDIDERLRERKRCSGGTFRGRT